MKSIGESVEMLAAFGPQGQVRPMKFRWTGDGGNRLIHVDRILSRQRQKIAGIPTLLFECQSLVEGRFINYQLKLDIEKNKWILLQCR